MVKKDNNWMNNMDVQSFFSFILRSRTTANLFFYPLVLWHIFSFLSNLMDFLFLFLSFTSSTCIWMWTPPFHSPTHPLSRKRKKNIVEGRVKAITEGSHGASQKCICYCILLVHAAATYLLHSFAATLPQRTIAN